ncbi:hypothetical protein B0A55_05849 [Friedmanniomyces simplex]|uniref:Protein kinase domain-containing protein n=1 Tax=Friedmanniomyces simplex TaxID=329884 RepID=A0A4V5NGY5_9PEZI|nr:hypothetical protein B0A55_05849 [Friedmanniomyces simplex]
MEDSRLHFRLNHDEFKLLGEGWSGVAYLAVKKTNADIPQSPTTEAPNLPATHPVVPTDPRVVKYYKADMGPDGTDLQKEIDILKTLCAGHSHPGIVSLLDFHIDGPVQWMTTPFMSGGTLYQFSQRYPEAITVPFVWHVAHSVASALLYVFFDITSRGPTEDTRAEPHYWPLCNTLSHGDLHSGNILLGPALPEHLFSNFPALLLSDFGDGDFWPHAEGAPPREYLLKQAQDLFFFGGVMLPDLAEIAQYTRGTQDPGLADWTHKLKSMEQNPDKHWLTSDSLRELLLDFHATAARQWEKDVQPMPDYVKDAIAVVPQLAASRRGVSRDL